MQLLAGEIHLYFTLHFNDFLWLLEKTPLTVFDTGNQRVNIFRIKFWIAHWNIDLRLLSDIVVLFTAVRGS